MQHSVQILTDDTANSLTLLYKHHGLEKSSCTPNSQGAMAQMFSSINVKCTKTSTRNPFRTRASDGPLHFSMTTQIN